jgi:hypothetical protein
MSVPKPNTAPKGRSLPLLLLHCKSFWSLLLLTLYSIPSFSQNVGNWNFNNTTTGTGGPYNTVAAAAFSAGIPTVAYNGGAEYFGENGWPAGGVNTNAYLQFSLTPNAGYQLDLTDVTLRIRRSNTGSPVGSGPTQWSLRSSVDGFTTDIASGTLTHVYNVFTVNLTGFYHLYSTVTFRLYGYGVSISSGGSNRLVADNIAVNGLTTVLPLLLTGLQADRINGINVTVNWQANSIQHGTVFHVRRSVNGTDFTTINSFSEAETRLSASYSFTDAAVPADAPDVYYRIEAKEPSGWTLVSWLVKINNKQAELALINYTSVQGRSLIASLQVPERGSYSISITGVNGVLLQKKTIQLEAGANIVRFDLGNIAHGTYAMRVTNNQVAASKRFVY